MKKIIMLAMIVCLFIPHISTAEAVPGIDGLSTENGRIVGAVNTVHGFQLQVDMPIPVECRDRIKQYKMTSRSMTKKEVKSLLSGKVLTGVPDAKWVYRDTDNEGMLFQFQEDNLNYSWPYCCERYMPIDSSTASKELLRAEATIHSLLDAMNVSYEYPFYTVAKAYQTMNAQSYPVNIESLDDLKQILLNGHLKRGEQLFDFYDSHKGFDDEYIHVFVRLQAEGIPFAYHSIVSPSYRDDKPVFDAGAYFDFQLTSDGLINYAKAGNIQDIVQEAAENRPVLSWPECLTALCADDKKLERLESGMLVRAELCYAINQKHVTYPVWQFVIEIYYEGTEFPHASFPFPFYVDAITGKCL